MVKFYSSWRCLGNLLEWLFVDIGVSIFYLWYLLGCFDKFLSNVIELSLNDFNN